MTSPLNYKPVNFDTEDLAADKLQQLSNNVQYMFDNMSKVRYKMGSVERESGVKMLTGRSVIPIRKDRSFSRLNVYFNNFFTSGCRPIVIVTGETIAGRIEMTTLGLGGGSIDHTGFRVQAASEAYKYIPHTVYAHWVAIGY